MRRFRHRRTVVIGSVVAVLGLITATAGARTLSGAESADAGWREETRLATAELPSNASPKPLLRISGVKLAKGESRLIVGKLSATMKFASTPDDDARRDMLMSTWTTCSTGEPTSTTAYPSRSAMSTRNHEGSGTRAVTSIWLFTAPADGTYNCVQWAVGKYTLGPNRKLVPVSGSGNTHLRVSNAAYAGGKEWYQRSDRVVRKDNPSTSAREDISRVLQETWTASDHASQIKVFHGTEATSGVEGIAGMDPLVLKLTLRITQLNSAGKACRDPRSTTDKVAIYQGSTHHLKVSRWETVPVATGNGCTRKFRIEVLGQYVLTYTGGTPNKAGMLHGALSDPLRPYTTALAVNG